MFKGATSRTDVSSTGVSAATHLVSACVYYSLCKPFRGRCMCPQVPFHYNTGHKKETKSSCSLLMCFLNCCRFCKSFRKLGAHVIDIVASRWCDIMLLWLTKYSLPPPPQKNTSKRTKTIWKGRKSHTYVGACFTRNEPISWIGTSRVT